MPEEFIGPPIPHHLHHRRYPGEGLLEKIEELPGWQLAALAGAVVLGADYLLAPKGRSLAAKALARLQGEHVPAIPGPHALPPGPPAPLPHPLPHPATQVAGLRGAGWGRGYMPYGGWAHANPAGPYPYWAAGVEQHHPGHPGAYAWE